MILYPNAKINIGLKVLNKREDGFHNLETLFYPVGLADILEVVESNELGMEQYGIGIPAVAGKNELMDPQANLCVKAYRLLKEDFDIPPVAIYLHKNIPVGAGLGGGSSDAAHTILAINKLYNLNLTNSEMAQYASRLGSDCAFFIYNEPMMGRGRGEILTPFALDSLADYTIKLVHPPVYVSTADAYRGIVPRDLQSLSMLDRRPLEELLQQPVGKWKESVVNDFETTVFAKYPLLAEYKKTLYDEGALYAAMSGSGSTLFGIFEK
ncbi:MAG: 4-(cytidine 5'-diphospho)-2-C-methyl-D-erythritol kinase [Bacteroidales bacterium]|nr:4-(cytidine 5'-diphospho)-2-C-methyl-D-erythritol kinase [Bacteroidales bacterium]